MSECTLPRDNLYEQQAISLNVASDTNDFPIL